MGECGCYQLPECPGVARGCGGSGAKVKKAGTGFYEESLVPEPAGCACCGRPRRLGRTDDPWDGRMDAYCYDCALARCDTTDSTCPASVPWPEIRDGDPLADKLAVFDEHAPAAVRYLIDWLRDNPEQIIAVARGRLITGHYVYGDKMMYEYQQGRLLKETLEELADGVVYTHVFLDRR